MTRVIDTSMLQAENSEKQDKLVKLAMEADSTLSSVRSLVGCISIVSSKSKIGSPIIVYPRMNLMHVWHSSDIELAKRIAEKYECSGEKEFTIIPAYQS